MEKLRALGTDDPRLASDPITAAWFANEVVEPVVERAKSLRAELDAVQVALKRGTANLLRLRADAQSTQLLRYVNVDRRQLRQAVLCVSVCVSVQILGTRGAHGCLLEPRVL